MSNLITKLAKQADPEYTGDYGDVVLDPVDRISLITNKFH